MTELRVLGPVEVWAGGQAIDLGAAKRRAVLTALILNPGSPVPVETLINRVWDEKPPSGARNVLYAHLSRIRKVFADAVEAEDRAGGRRRPAVLDRRSGGYLVRIEPDRVDLHRFRRLIDEARVPSLTDRARAAKLSEAIGLWRGDPLCGLTGEWIGRLRENLRRQHVDAVVAWAKAELRLGGHDTVIETVRSLASEYAMTEPLTAVLIRALSAAGRGAEALDTYGALRERLADELGVTPGPELQTLYQAILRGGLALGDRASPEVPEDLRTALLLLAGQVTNTIELLERPAPARPNATTRPAETRSSTV
jgi:DNA-binding SARP family transcriptional activator